MSISKKETMSSMRYRVVGRSLFYLFGFLDNNLGGIDKGVVEVCYCSLGVLICLVTDESKASRVSKAIVASTRTKRGRGERVRGPGRGFSLRFAS